MKRQKMTDMDSKSGEETRNLRHFPKTDVRFWQQSIFRKGYTVSGQRRVTKEWYARMQHNGERDQFALGTPNKLAAAARARDVYLSLLATGWESTRQRYKKSPVVTSDPGSCTVGDYITAVKSLGLTAAEKTVEGYSQSLRLIVSETFGFGGKGKFDYKKGGHKEWLQRVNAVPLTELTPARVQNWKKAFLTRAEKDAIAQRRAKISVNSIMRQARSLFSPKVLRHLTLSLPDPLPFSGIEFEPRQTMKYQSKIDVVDLMRAAEKDLLEASPESYEIFLLAVAVGLRRKEIDLLEWSSFRWNDCLIRIQPTEWFHPKSEDSLADVPVDPEVMDLFKRHHTSGSGRFVIKCDRPPQPRTSQQYYRCAPHFDKLIDWLRDHGVAGNKPLHTLRKEYGSLITEAHGIYAASRALRHTDLRTTSEHYVDSRSRATPGIGRLLAKTE